MAQVPMCTGLLFSLHILALHLQRPGVYNPDTDNLTGQDHVIYFRTRDMPVDHKRGGLCQPGMGLSEVRGAVFPSQQGGIPNLR